MSNIRRVFAPLGTVSLFLLGKFATLLLTALPTPASSVKDIEFLGQVTLPTGTQFEGTEVGGLSGITYDAKKNVYYAISDDRGSETSAARFYTLEIDLSQGKLQNVNFTSVTTLLNEDKQPFAPLSLDPEGITLTKNGALFISSEGDANTLISPFVNKFSLSGEQLQELPVPEKFLPTESQERGIRNNLAFESLTITRNQKYLFTATENALYQDGPETTTINGSRSRILKYNLVTDQPEAEYLYLTDPVAAEPIPAGKFSTNGLVDLLAISNNRFLSLERSFSTGVGNTIKLYEVSVEGANDISDIKSLADINLRKVRAAKKKLLLDLAELDINLDNIEGLTFGPDLPDGRRSLIVVSDNNFSPTQFTQVLAFGIKYKPFNLPQKQHQ